MAKRRALFAAGLIVSVIAAASGVYLIWQGLLATAWAWAQLVFCAATASLFVWALALRGKTERYEFILKACVLFGVIAAIPLLGALLFTFLSISSI